MRLPLQVAHCALTQDSDFDKDRLVTLAAALKASEAQSTGLVRTEPIGYKHFHPTLCTLYFRSSSKCMIIDYVAGCSTASHSKGIGALLHDLDTPQKCGAAWRQVVWDVPQDELWFVDQAKLQVAQQVVATEQC